MKCPKCGKEGTLKLQSMFQYALENKILKNGEVSKAKPKRVDIGPEDWSCVYCDNCGSFWGSDDDDDGYYLKDNKIHFENEALEEIAYGCR